MVESYYIYEHWRLDKNECFYVGMSSDINQNKFNRAYDFRKSYRNELWNFIYNQSNKNIKVKITYKNLSLEECASKEIFYILKYGRIGFENKGTLSNKKLGSYSKDQKIVQYSKEGLFIKIWNGIIEASEELKFSKSSIWKAVNNKNLCHNYQWRKFISNKDLSKNIGEFNFNNNKIYQFNEDGILIKSYNYISEASKKTGIDKSSIRRCAIKESVLAGGFMWSYEDKVTVPKSRCIIQYDLNMNEINRYKTVKDAMRAINKNTTNNINKCLNGIQKHAYGFIYKEIKFIK